MAAAFLLCFGLLLLYSFFCFYHGQVELRYQRKAYIVFTFCLVCFIAYSFALMAITAHRRERPPTRVTATSGKSWVLPNMVRDCVLVSISLLLLYMQTVFSGNGGSDDDDDEVIWT